MNAPDTYRGWTIRRAAPEAGGTWEAIHADVETQPTFTGASEADVMLQVDEHLLELDEAEDLRRSGGRGTGLEMSLPCTPCAGRGQPAMCAPCAAEARAFYREPIGLSRGEIAAAIVLGLAFGWTIHVSAIGVSVARHAPVELARHP